MSLFDRPENAREDREGAQLTPAKAGTKQSRMRSPSLSTTAEGSSSRLHAPKRARKAINCEPCRTSKLKCDRNRPCSSCVLRGTTASCYQGLDSDPGVPREDQHVDPALELSRIRQSLNLIESHIYHNPAHRPVSAAASLPILPVLTPASYRQPPSIADDTQGMPLKTAATAESTSTPGMLGLQDSGGLYAGPTNPASLITTSDREDSKSQSPAPSLAGPSSQAGVMDGFSATSVAYDSDLVQLLPPVETIDGLVEYYFEYCNWVYHHVNEATFRAAWGRFKTGQCGDRVVLATACTLIALTVRYLPAGHALFHALPGTCEEIGEKYYGLMRTALQRYRDDAKGLVRTYTIELIELLLLRTHYLSFAQEDPEEPWSVRGELMSIATAIGLHRDPGKSRFDGAEAERRRWAWWHIMVLDRWQAFMFGRPTMIAAHHYNTAYPDCTYHGPFPAAFFGLAAVVGEIMNDAVSFRSVPYSTVLEQDKLLTRWYDHLPAELDLDDYAMARSLTSPVMAVQRLAVQSIIVRTAYYHFRFTVHRPYAALVAESREIAVSSASQLIGLISLFLSNRAVTIYGHFTWQPFHAFSAAMFFSFQLITRPDQPAAYIFKDNIRKAMDALQHCRWLAVADKALTILEALAPLYSAELLTYTPEERKRRKAQVLRLVRTLAFPYQNAPGEPVASSPSMRHPSRSTSATRSPPQQVSSPLHEHGHTQVPVSSVRWNPSRPELSPAKPYAQQQQQTPPQHLSQPQHIAYVGASPALPPIAYTSPHIDGMHQMPPQAQGASAVDATYMHPADDSAMWGASIGFGMGEWTQFIDAVHRPEGRPRCNGDT
ncbi:hypothetical protein SCP_0204190 [Sparassis crispa]|uniref:Zn(2)-C6 fungal-type domain-containing protein n=1 Tax=Sparassis crispa TaxID=139825 RepID=A0A401GAN6_9APHY|nr:hypothetical protein SCP_0204190 [Sparassis crispa]GBE79222.1 hypothetical protein SCP_0204190 [Sparassis crispa]